MKEKIRWSCLIKNVINFGLFCSCVYLLIAFIVISSISGFPSYLGFVYLSVSSLKSGFIISVLFGIGFTGYFSHKPVNAPILEGNKILKDGPCRFFKSEKLTEQGWIFMTQKDLIYISFGAKEVFSVRLEEIQSIKTFIYIVFPVGLELRMKDGTSMKFVVLCNRSSWKAELLQKN